MTEMEAYDKLGLVEPDHYAAVNVLNEFGQGAGTGRRQTGRTTRMLVLAAIALCEGKTVYLRSHTDNYTKILQTKCYRMALQLKPELGPVFEQEPGGRGIGVVGSTLPAITFVDHIIYEWIPE